MLGKERTIFLEDVGSLPAGLVGVVVNTGNEICAARIEGYGIISGQAAYSVADVEGEVSIPA